MNEKGNVFKDLSLTRRDFLKGLAAAGLLGGSLGSGWGTIGTGTTEIPKWVKEADVVVVGTGLAGLSTAISAHDEGADVLVIEKMQKKFEGGNSRVSGNMWWVPTNVPEGIDYIRAMAFGTVEEEVFPVLAKEIFKNNDYIRGLGGEPEEIPGHMAAPENPQLAGSGCVRTYFLGVPLGGGKLWNLYSDHVKSRGIEILYETPAKELVQDADTGGILGVKAESGGAKINIKAKKAVVLACGGFEFDFKMQKQYFPGWPIYSVGTPGDTGDGIRMAQMVGADLWHMNNPMGPLFLGMITPEFEPIPVPTMMFYLGYIYVDKHGKRFMNELRETRHGYGWKEIILDFDGLEGEFPRIPLYVIFDETTRKAGPLLPPIGEFTWFMWFSGHKWSPDNSAEIAKGWIKKADTIDGLARKIGVDAATLKDTLTKYNHYCEIGEDAEFGRPKEAMPLLGKPTPALMPLTTPPYYAIEAWPLMVNTQGGPKRNVRCQVVDPYGKPIPRLYSTGELGSFWGWMYNAGGNLSECMATGRIAGKNATAEKPWK